MYNRDYRFEFYDTASAENYTLLRPAVVILCYSISDPQSLKNVRTHWKPMVETHFNDNDSTPVILLGLKRDIRSEEDYGGSVKPAAGNAESEDHQPLNGREFVYPQEALSVAQGMRCDRYCECSAVTGEVSVYLCLVIAARLTSKYLAMQRSLRRHRKDCSHDDNIQRWQS